MLDIILNLDQLRSLIVFLFFIIAIISLFKNKYSLFIKLSILIIFLLSPLYFYYQKLPVKKNSKGSFLRIIQQNCWGKNNNPEPLIAMILQKNPDIVFLQECSPIIFQQLQRSSLSLKYNIFSQFEYNQKKLFYNRLVILARGFEFIKKFDHFIVPIYQIYLKEKNSSSRIINLINVHLERPYLIGFDYYQNFISSLDQHIKPTILSGDFNSVPWSKQIKFILKELALNDTRQGQGLGPTYPACFPYGACNILLFPIFPIDSIFVSNHFVTHSFETLPFIGSDHYGIQVDVFWPLSESLN